MKKKTEAISCIIDSKKAEATKIVQTEQHPMTNEQLVIVLNKLIVVVAILAFAAVLIFGSAIKAGLATFAVFIVSMVRLGIHD